MLTSRSNFSLAVSPCSSYVYVFGGKDRDNDNLISGKVEYYNISQDQWYYMSAHIYLLPQLVDPVTITMPDGIYILGGYQDLNYTGGEHDKTCLTGQSQKQVFRFDTKQHSI